MKWQAIIEYFPELLKASVLTIELVVLSCVAGLILGVVFGLLRLSRHTWVRIVPFLYGYFFRGTPLLVQIFLIYYGLGQFKVIQDSVLWEPVLSQPYWCAIIAFTLNTGAYVAEIVRGAVLAIPKGELEAADAIGMSPTQKLHRIVIPRAFGIMVPAYSNEVIFMIKGSALASTITLMDLTNKAKSIISETYLTIELFLAAGLIYLAMTFVFLMLAKAFERVINRHKYYKAV